MEIVINNQYGGFELSEKAVREYLKLKGKEVYAYSIKFFKNEIYYEKTKNSKDDVFVFYFTKDLGTLVNRKELNDETYEKYSFNSNDISRTDKDLIKVVEKLGEEANVSCSTSKVIEIPDDVDWVIEEYDGNEWVAEKHRIWK